jgi:hypothetical protein
MGPNVNFEQELRRRIREAKKILGISDCDENEIKKSLLNTLFRDQYVKRRVGSALKPENKKQKQALERVRKSLSRLIVTLQDDNLLHHVRNRMKVDKLREHLQLVDKLARLRLPTPRRRSHLQREAVRQSAYLLELHNIPRTTSRQGKFCRLAAVLYGDRIADLFEHCRACRRQRSAHRSNT